MIMAAEGISKSELLDILKSISDPNSFYENEKRFYFAQKPTPRIGYISEENELQQMELENELYLSEMSYISDTSVDDINVESP